MTKLCKDCKHYNNKGWPFKSRLTTCDIRVTPDSISLISGETIPGDAVNADFSRYNDSNHLDLTLCGREARFFEPLDTAFITDTLKPKPLTFWQKIIRVFKARG